MVDLGETWTFSFMTRNTGGGGASGGAKDDANAGAGGDYEHGIHPIADCSTVSIFTYTLTKWPHYGR